MRHTRLNGALLTLALVLAAAPAAAKDDVQHQFSLTVSPLHLVFPVVELTGEYRLADKWGIAGIVGAGSIDPAQFDDSTVETDRWTVIEAGASGRYYVLGSFIHGMQLGLELLYVYVSGSATDGSTTATGTGQGFSVGPFVGYKIATNVGFTFDAQLGYAFLVSGAEAEDDDTGETETASTSAHGVLLNLNVGWSF